MYFGARRETCPGPLGTPCDEKPNRWLFPWFILHQCRYGFKSLTSACTKQNKKSHLLDEISLFTLVPGERLELSHRKATASKTVVSTISPPGQV
jgi:hypothetical protein